MRESTAIVFKIILMFEGYFCMQCLPSFILNESFIYMLVCMYMARIYVWFFRHFMKLNHNEINKSMFLDYNKKSLQITQQIARLYLKDYKR